MSGVLGCGCGCGYGDLIFGAFGGYEYEASMFGVLGRDDIRFGIWHYLNLVLSARLAIVSPLDYYVSGR
jgi:hypothetical protein